MGQLCCFPFSRGEEKINIPVIPIMLDSPLKEAFACCKGIILIKEAGKQQMQHGGRDGNKIGEKQAAEPDDAELVSLSKRLVENAVLKAVQQYLEETQNKSRQTDGSPAKTEEAASSRKSHEADIVKEALHRETQALLPRLNRIKELLMSPEIRTKISKELFEDRHNSLTVNGKVVLTLSLQMHDCKLP